MTKTLTEQWREGTLESGWYYIKIYWGAGYDIIFDNYNPTTGLFVDFGKEVKEVLAPVPSYDEYCNIVFQANKPKNPLSDVMMCYDTEREKKVVERLQEQLKEANKTILDQELIIKRLKRRRICTNQKEKARKEHINELIAQVKELKEEVARRGRFINELKSQRKEANDIIRLAEHYDPFATFSPATAYIKKWGVK